MSDAREAGLGRRTVESLRAHGARVVVVDVRSADEFAAGTVFDARHLPADQVEAAAAELAGALVVTVCTHGGHRSQGAASRLRALGIDAAHLVGGVRGA